MEVDLVEDERWAKKCFALKRKCEEYEEVFFSVLFNVLGNLRICRPYCKLSMLDKYTYIGINMLVPIPTIVTIRKMLVL